jgi:hypothetical protein
VDATKRIFTSVSRGSSIISFLAELLSILLAGTTEENIQGRNANSILNSSTDKSAIFQGKTASVSSLI